MPTLKEMLQGRENMHAYAYFAFFFLPIVVGRNICKQRFQERISFNNLATTSDEAFGLLLLDNYWEKWKFIEGKSKQAIKDAKDQGDMPKAKFIAGNQDDSRTRNGWSNQGLRRYVEFGDAVLKDKEEDNDEKWTEEFYTIANEQYRSRTPQNMTGDGDKLEEMEDINLWME